MSARIVLASASAVRRAMLASAGIECAIEASNVDEDAIKRAKRAEAANVADTALALAEAKALAVSARHPEAIVLGADQMLELGSAWLDKPADREMARAHLRAMAGRAHRLVCGVVAVRAGRPCWRHCDSARLDMRVLSADFIEDYLDAVGQAAFASVGAYQLEGRGAQLFTRIEGDYFTVLGLPLLAVLDFLRREGALAS